MSEYKTSKYSKYKGVELTLEYGDQIKVKTEVGDLIINGNGIMVIVPDFSNETEDTKKRYKSCRIDCIDDWVRREN